MAYSNMSQLRMLADDVDGARSWGERAIELAERLGETEIVVHALNNVGTAELERRPAAGDKLERSLALPLEAGLEEHVARATPTSASRADRAAPTTRSATSTSGPGSPTAASTTSTPG